MEFINKEILDYSAKNTEHEPDLLKKLNRETWLKVMNPRMLSGHIQGRVLSMLSKMIKPRNIIEIGTYTGYSALCLAEGIQPKGKLHTIDINEECVLIANKYFQNTIFKNNIKQHIGNALEIIPKIKCNFQLAFIDADKENYINYFNMIFNKLDVGGYIIADNVLWSGKVLKKQKDVETQSLDDYNKMIINNKKLKSVLMPIRDGLMVSEKIYE